MEEMGGYKEEKNYLMSRCLTPELYCIRKVVRIRGLSEKSVLHPETVNKVDWT